MKTIAIAGAVLAAAMTLSTTAATAECVSKGAVATAGSADSAKWYALETMVQAVSWGLWPGFVATNKVEGYTIKGERYKCNPDGGQVTCHGRATFCKN
ncbi:MAG: hypothetical protein IPL91_04610 [Hyphomicrobium sp.]|mgnify:CR=1 FL=1|nr:hypothetical protein [Hyphomicrobium sp.]